MGTVDSAAGSDGQKRPGPVPHYREPVPTSTGLPAPRMTRQRKAVTDLLSEFHDFRSAQQIHATLQERGDNIGLATIYRPLALMANSRGVDVLTHEEAHYSSTSPAPSPHRPTGAPSTARSSTSTSRPMRAKSSSRTLTSSSHTRATPASFSLNPTHRTGPEPSAPGRSRAWSQMRPTYLLSMNPAAVTGR